MVKRDTVAVATSVAAVLGTGGALTTIGPWYLRLEKPPWQPPGWLFAPAWTLIGICTGIAAREAWRRAGPDAGRRRRVLLLFGANGLLNALWSGLFFTKRRPDWALAEVVPLWLSIASLIVFGPRPRGRSIGRDGNTWLLAPYLAWVSFATVLNASIVRRNAPFGADD